MIILMLFASFTIMVSAVPVRNGLPPLLSRGGATQAPRVQPVEATNQKQPQTPAPLSLEQAQPGVLQQPGPHGGPQLVPSLHQYTWSPVGGSQMMMPLQPNIQESVPPNQPLTQQPLILPPYGYFPLFLSPYTNQLFSPYRFPMLFEAPLPQTPANLPANSPLLPAEAQSVAAPSGDAPQPMQQNAQIMYMLQQPVGSPLGSLSSEELEIAAKMSQLGVYMPAVLTNLQTGAVQPLNQAAGLANPEQQGVAPTDGTPPAGVPQTQTVAGSGPQPNTNRVPAGLEVAAQDATTVHTPVQPKLQGTQGNLARDCGHQQR